MVNSVMLVGRLVQEPEIIESETGKQKNKNVTIKEVTSCI